MTPSSNDQEGWVDVCDEETPNESPTTDSGFEIIASSSDGSSTSRDHAIVTESPTPSSTDRISSFATHKGAPFEDYFCSFRSSVLIDEKEEDEEEVEEKEEEDSNQIQRSSRLRRRRRHSRRRSTIIEVIIESTIDNSFGVKRYGIRRRIPAKCNPIGRQTLKFDHHNDAQSSSKFDHEFERPPYEPPLQQEGDDATPDQDPEFEALLEGPWKSCYLDEVD